MTSYSVDGCSSILSRDTGNVPLPLCQEQLYEYKFNHNYLMHRHIITCKELNVQTDKANLILTDAYTLLQSALNISSFPSYYVIILLRLILWNCKIRYARDE